MQVTPPRYTISLPIINAGAPQWAVLTDGWPGLSILGIDELNLAGMKAFQNFWDNVVPPNATQGQAPGAGLQDHYIGTRCLAPIVRSSRLVSLNRLLTAGDVVNLCCVPVSVFSITQVLSRRWRLD